jgi:hypothetical protein
MQREETRKSLNNEKKMSLTGIENQSPGSLYNKGGDRRSSSKKPPLLGPSGEVNIDFDCIPRVHATAQQLRLELSEPWWLTVSTGPS